MFKRVFNRQLLHMDASFKPEPARHDEYDPETTHHYYMQNYFVASFLVQQVALLRWKYSYYFDGSVAIIRWKCCHYSVEVLPLFGGSVAIISVEVLPLLATVSDP